MSKLAITNALRHRVKALHEANLSLRAIEKKLAEEGVSVSYVTVGKILREPIPDAPMASHASQAPPEPPRELVPMPELPDTASVAARVLWSQLDETRRRIAKLPAGADHATEYAALQRVALAQLKELEKMIPAPPKDPALNPHNIAAREALHAHVLSTIEAVEARAGRFYVGPDGRRPPRDDP